MILLKAVILLVLLVLSFFFSLTETVLVSLDKFKMRELKGKKTYLTIENLLNKPSLWLTDILVGNSLVNIIFATITTSMAIEYAYTMSLKKELVVGITFILTTLMILIFGEIIPKTIARVYTLKFVPFVLRPFLIIDRILFPVSKLLIFLTGIFIKPKKEQQEKKLTKKELFFLLRAGTKEGALEKEEEEMIYRVLGFKNITVDMIMTKREKLEAIPLSRAKDRDIFLDLVMEIGKSRIPIYENNLDNIIGVVYAKDLLTAACENISFDIAKFIHSPLFVPEDMKISQLFEELNKKKKHIALIRESEKIKGLVTMEDVLEEIVGEILDEYDLARIKKR